MPDPGVPGVVAPWCEVDSVKGDERIKNATLPDGVTVEDCVAAASYELYKASGSRWSGVREDVIRWRRLPPAGGGFSGWGWSSEATGSLWNRAFPEGWGVCDASNELFLPGPVTLVEAISIDGEVLDSDQYGVFDNRRLVRFADADGNLRSWPLYQDLGTPLDEVGTFAVAFAHGAAPPMAGSLAAREWSIQKVLFVSTNKEKLPQRSTRISRQGVDVTIEHGDMLKDGKVGIPLVDTFLTFANPKRLNRRARSYSPDDPQPAILSQA